MDSEINKMCQQKITTVMLRAATCCTARKVWRGQVPVQGHESGDAQNSGRAAAVAVSVTDSRHTAANAIDGAPPPNRVVIFQYPNKEASDKTWSESIKPWQMSEQVRKLADFPVFGVEAVEQK
jgi:hypothetical protein